MWPVAKGWPSGASTGTGMGMGVGVGVGADGDRVAKRSGAGLSP